MPKYAWLLWLLPASVDQNSHWGEAHHAIVSTWLSTKCRPTIDRALTNYWPIHRWSIDELSAKCRWSIGERKAISAETHLERLSTVSRPSVVRLSSESRPTIDRLSTAISTAARPIDRSTLPKHDPRISVLVWALFLLCSSATIICYLGWIL